MKNQENQAQDRDYKIYIPSTHQFVPVTKEVYYDYYRPIWRIRKQAQKYGQCMCPQIKLRDRLGRVYARLKIFLE